MDAQQSATVQFGGTLALAIAACSLLAAIAYLRLPDAALAQAPASEYLPAVMANRAWFTLLWGSQALIGVLGLGVVPAVTILLRPITWGWFKWLTNLAYLGFALTAVDLFRYLWMIPFEARVFENSDEVVQRMVAGDSFHLSLDPSEILKYCTVGLWLVAVSVAAYRSRLLHRNLSILGGLAGLGYIILGLEDILPIPGIEMIAVLISGVIIGPIWWTWLGFSMRSTRP